ncbi:MAG: hypothetical protein Q8O41_05415 [Candidatus Methanoperedens sp.]|nr:hypothetical protein [Candidatus Methanoperedens sp.]
MPLFNPPNCVKKITAFIAGSILVAAILVNLVGSVGGLLGASLIMLLSLVAIWYLIDMFGDIIFTHKKCRPNNSEIEEAKTEEFNYYI